MRFVQKKASVLLRKSGRRSRMMEETSRWMTLPNIRAKSMSLPPEFFNESGHPTVDTHRNELHAIS